MEGLLKGVVAIVLSLPLRYRAKLVANQSDETTACSSTSNQDLRKPRLVRAFLDLQPWFGEFANAAIMHFHFDLPRKNA